MGCVSSKIALDFSEFQIENVAMNEREEAMPLLKDIVVLMTRFVLSIFEKNAFLLIPDPALGWFWLGFGKVPSYSPSQSSGYTCSTVAVQVIFSKKREEKKKSQTLSLSLDRGCSDWIKGRKLDAFLCPLIFFFLHSCCSDAECGE